MKETFVKLAGAVPSVLEHTTLSLSLTGWPATIAVAAVCIAAVTAYAIHEGVGSKEQNQSPNIKAVAPAA